MSAPKLSAAQWRMLEDAASGDAYARVRGSAAHGGAQGTRASLVRRDLLARNMEVTAAGRAALDARNKVTSPGVGHEPA